MCYKASGLLEIFSSPKQMVRKIHVCFLLQLSTSCLQELVSCTYLVYKKLCTRNSTLRLPIIEETLTLENYGNEHEDCYGTFQKLVRNSEYPKSDNFKELSVRNVSFKLCFV